MPGARIVLNSRYFHIAKAGEKADGKHVMTKDAAMGLVNYVGTRESVVLNMPNQISMNGEDITSLNLDPLKLNAEVAARPVTHKQMDLLSDLLHEFPEAKRSLEYQDFKTNPNIGNATELISHAAEFGLGFAVDLGKAKNLIEYVGKRPGVDRVGEHGLFSSSPEVDLKKAQEEISNCKGNIWTHVISLRREDADALGYDTQKPWRDLVLQKIDVIAKASNIPVSELHWYAGMHNTTHHPHIHLFIFSDNPKSGKLTVDGINKMKSEFSEVIFADERHHIYEHKDEMREGIKHQVDEILAGMKINAADQFTKKEMDALCEKLLRLGDALKDRSGKPQFGWIKDPDLKRQINDIMADLGKAPAIHELYRLYCEDHKELQGMYRNNPKDIGPLEKQTEFQVIRNKIIQEAVKLARAQPELAAHPEPVEEQTASTFAEPDYIPDSADDAPNTSEYWPEEYADESALSSPLSDEDSLFASVPDEKPDNTPPEDYAQTTGWDAKDDFEPTQNTESAEHRFRECWNKAVNGAAKSEYELAKARYDLAKMYFYGKGVEQDYEQARMWYGLAAEAGHSFAKYELGKMYLYGIGIDKDPELGKEYCLDAYWDFRNSVEKSYGFDIGKYVDDGTVKMEGYSGIKDAAYLMYCLGRMEYAGEGVGRDYGKAFRWYQLAAEGKHVHSNYCMAKMHYGGEGIPQDYVEALKCYRAAADGKDKYAYHALGKMFDTGTGVEQNYSVAADWFTMASREDVPYADYRLAQMYESGQGVEQDTELSGILYRKALEEFQKQEKQQPNAADEFRIAGMYLRGLGVDVNPEEAAKWLQLCIAKEDPRAQYQLAVMYQSGQGVEIDESKARQLYASALSGFLQLEQEAPASHIEYKIAGMYDRGNGTEEDKCQAFTWYCKAAGNGHPHAAYRAAKACYDGIGTDQDYRAAIKWFQLAAEGTDPYAMYALGKTYRDGIGTESDLIKSYQYFLAAAKLEHGFAQFAVAKALLHGVGTEKNVPRAMEWLEKCITRKNHFAEYEMAELLHNGKDIPVDGARAQELYSAALAGFLQAEQEEPNAQLEYRIGSMYLHGKGTELNPTEAFQWFEQSADQGNAYAAYQAAELLHEGKAVPNDEDRSQKYYAAALAGFLQVEEPDAQLEYRIGSMYLRGKGTESNPTEAFRWFEQSADHKNAYAAYQAAELLHEGRAVPQDEVRAQKYYTAALSGFLQVEEPDAQLEYRIGSIYLHGKGTKPNAAEALLRFERSTNLGNAYAAYQAAELLHDGKAVPNDEASAQKYYAAALTGFLAMEQEEPDAQTEYRIGSMYLQGNGTVKNPTEAMFWYGKSAEKGNAFAAYQAARLTEENPQPDSLIKSQYFYELALNGFLSMEQETPNNSMEYRIGQMLFSGKGCTVDKPAAFRWLLRSAEQNNPHAQFQVARMLQNGDGVLKDEIRAGEFYARAFQGFLKLNQEEPDSSLQYKIGTMFEFGLGVDRDVTAAKQWYRMAGDSGNEYAAERLSQIGAMETNMAIGSILNLFRALSQHMGDNIKDSTTHKYRQDRKLMQKQRELKAERGHKYDNQEQVM